MMIKFIYYSFFILLFLIPSRNVFGQVVVKKILTENHEGLINDMMNFPKEIIRHKWIFKSQDGLKSNYEVGLYKGKELICSYDVRMRNLSIAFYVEIRVKDKKGEIKTLSGIYDKGNKWLRVKMAAHDGCLKKGALWGRKNKISEFGEILDFIIREMDRNLDFSCYN